MNSKVVLVALAMILACAAFVGAHKNRFYNQPQYEPERCVCDCNGPRPQPVLPNKPYYGSAGYAQPPPRPSGGYGGSGAGAYAVSGSYGGGNGQVSGGY